VNLPRIALLVLGHRGDPLRAATVESWHAHAQHYELTRVVDVDDSHGLLGFCGAIRYGWARLREPGAAFDYVFHLEEDWIFERAFSIAHMARLLETEPQVAQVALRRGVEPAEHGVQVIDRFPREFVDRTTGMIGLGLPARTQEWLEHRLFWTTNPSLYRAATLEYDWPVEPRCEARFTEMMREAGSTFAYWGDRHDPAWITHTGDSREGGHGY
jgi:hypothetical protein